jgi:molybdopterin-guanine dinucleotide biosynthesis protein A
MPDFPITAVLLAGGQSRRMGRDKAKIEIDGRTLWKRQIELLQSLGLPRIVISGPADVYRNTGVEVLPDPLPNLGPLGGICTALQKCEGDAILVLAVDMPAMTLRFLQRITAVAAERRAGVVPRVGDMFEPLAAIYPTTALAVAERHLRDGILSLQPLARVLIEQRLAVPLDVAPGEYSLFQNLNTPADLAEYRADD